MDEKLINVNNDSMSNIISMKRMMGLIVTYSNN